MPWSSSSPIPTLLRMGWIKPNGLFQDTGTQLLQRVWQHSYVQSLRFRVSARGDTTIVCDRPPLPIGRVNDLRMPEQNTPRCFRCLWEKVTASTTRAHDLGALDTMDSIFLTIARIKKIWQWLDVSVGVINSSMKVERIFLKKWVGWSIIA